MSNNNNLRFYRHYKNKPYKYLGTVHHSETLEELALYETLYENPTGRIWVRPKAMFFENVTIEGVERPRFEKVEFKFKNSTAIDEALLLQLDQVYEVSFGKEMDIVKVKSVLQAHTQFHCVMAYDKDALVGFKLGYVRDKVQFYSWLGGVLPAYRGLGLASELMRQQHEWCKQQKFKKVRTHTSNRFPEMISLNLKHGFEIIGTYTSKDKPIKLIMEKSL